MPRTTDAPTDPDQYVLRQFEPTDLDALLALDRAVWDRRRSAAWFRWKYEENPYLEGAPILVVERDGDIVGARPLLAFRLRAGGTSASTSASGSTSASASASKPSSTSASTPSTPASSATALALQPADTMVHPDHRRRGLFTRMTRRTIERHADGEAELFFNFPNDAAFGGYRKLGWQPVGPRRGFYRVESPDRFLSDAVDGPVWELLARLSTPAVRSLYRLQRRVATRSIDRSHDSAGGLTVEERAGGDPEQLATLYRRAPPREVHALRDPTFYRWWLASPAWRYRTLLARDEDGVRAALVARSRTTDGGVTVTQLAEVTPLTGGDRWREAVGALVARAVADADGEDLFSAAGSAIPRPVLAANGFLAGSAPPLRQLRGSPSTMVVRPAEPADPDNWSLGGRSLLERDQWRLSFCEHDTA